MSSPPPPNLRSNLARRRSPLLLLAAALVALAAFLAPGGQPAQAQQSTVWSATLTATATVASYVVGCDDASTGEECSSTSVLTDNDFTYDDVEYQVRRIVYVTSTDSLIFELAKTIPDSLKAALTLNVGNSQLALAGGTLAQRANRPQNSQLSISNTGSLWSAGDTVSLSLTEAAKPTVSISASPTRVDEGSPVTITLTLSEALSSRVTIPLVVYGFSAEPGDYGRLASITIPANSLTGTGRIATRHDADIRDDVFGVDLGTLPPEVVAGSPSSVAITIIDDDYPDTLSDLQSLPIDYSQQRPASERTPTGAGAGGSFCYVGAGNGATEYIRYPDGRIEETTKQDPVIRSMFAC